MAKKKQQETEVQQPDLIPSETESEQSVEPSGEAAAPLTDQPEADQPAKEAAASLTDQPKADQPAEEAAASLTDQLEADQPAEEVEMLTFRRKKREVQVAANRTGTIAVLKNGGFEQVKTK